MSVDTYLKGKNLQPYRRGETKDDLRVLVAPELYRLGLPMRIYAKGRVKKKLAAVMVVDRAAGDACST